MGALFELAGVASASAVCLALACSASNGSTAGADGAGGSPQVLPSAGGAFEGGGAGGVSSVGGSQAGGSDSSGGTSSSGGASIVAPPDASAPYPYDPSVTFDWPETVTKGPCLAGTYEGTFSCTLDLFAGLVATQITGPVNFTLEQSANGEFLVIKDGSLAGVANTTIKFDSPLTGQLDCSANTFHADAPQGTYSDGAFISGTFTGGLDAKLDRATQTLNGTWDLAPSATGTPCAGNWTAVRKP